MNQIAIFVENKPGRLSEITGVLHEAGIDIRALSLADTTDFGILRLIVSDPNGAKKALQNAGVTVSITKVIGIAIEDRPGGLSEALKVLYERGVSVEYMYAFVSPQPGRAQVILRVNDNDKAVAELKAHGFSLIGSEPL